MRGSTRTPPRTSLGRCGLECTLWLKCKASFPYSIDSSSCNVKQAFHFSPQCRMFSVSPLFLACCAINCRSSSLLMVNSRPFTDRRRQSRCQPRIDLRGTEEIMAGIHHMFLYPARVRETCPRHHACFGMRMRITLHCFGSIASLALRLPIMGRNRNFRGGRAPPISTVASHPHPIVAENSNRTSWQGSPRNPTLKLKARY